MTVVTDFCSEIADLRRHVRAWRAKGERVALVPTMGALHAGHLSLVEAARRTADRTIVTIFVNPTQFAPNEDFSAYPRDVDADRAKIEQAGADLVFAPPLPSVYPEGFATAIEVAGPAKAGLEDNFRRIHFVGVATIVMKLLMQAQPDVALFGEKDFQQLKVIERMVLDLDVPIEIRGVPTVREADGLALSSRNVYLDASERVRAPALHEALARCAAAIERGGRVADAIADARERIADAGFVTDYIDVRHADTLVPFDPDEGAPGRVLAAGRLGRTRLIDNVLIAPRGALRPGANATG